MSLSKIEKLNKQENIFVGREKETKLILDEYKMYLSGQAGVVAVVGDAGIGKTTLIENALAKSGSFIYGKCRENSTIELVPIVNMLDQIIEYILALPKKQSLDLSVKLKNTLKQDLSLLCEITPNIKKIVNTVAMNSNMDYSRLKYRIKNAVFNFVSISALYIFPLTIYIDDLHSADKMSLEIIKTLVKKKDKSNVFLVVSYRDKEINMDMMDFIGTLKDKTKYIYLDKLTFISLEAYIKEFFDDTIKDINRVVKIVDSLALGNPFYIKEVLDTLVSDKVIIFSKGSYRVSNHSISEFLDSSNTKNLLFKKLNSINKDNSYLLELIVCLDDIDYEIIEQITGFCKDDIDKDIKQLIDASMLKDMQDYKRGYTHDIISKAVYDNINIEQKKKIHYLIANVLLHRYQNFNEKSLGTAVSHLLNSSTDSVRNDADKWIYTHGMGSPLFDAGIKAKATGNIEKAIQIFEFCEELAPYSDKTSYEFVANLKMEIAECLCLLGQSEKANLMLKSLLDEYGEKSIAFKIKVKQLYLYHYQRKHDSVIMQGEKLLKELGISVNKLSMPYNLAEFTLLYSKKRIDRIATNDEINDEKVLLILDILRMMTICATLSEHPLSGAICLKAAIYSAKHGKTTDSIIGYVSSAYIMLSILDDKKRAKLLENVILKILVHSQDVSNHSFAYFIFGTFFSYWSKSIKKSEEDLENSITFGELSGDSVFLGYSILSILDTKAILGVSCDEMMGYIEYIKQEYSDIEQYSTAYCLEAHKTHVLALKNGSDTCDEDEVGKKYPELTIVEKFTEEWLVLQRLYLFGKTKEAYVLTQKLAKNIKVINGLISKIDIQFFSVLVRIKQHENLNQTEKKKNKHQIKKLIKELEKVAELNSADFEAMYNLAFAEYHAYIKKNDSAYSLYDKALSLASNDRIYAMTSLLFARYCKNNNTESYHAEQAAAMFNALGADYLASMIKDEFSINNQASDEKDGEDRRKYRSIIRLGNNASHKSEGDIFKEFIEAIIQNGYSDYVAVVFENKHSLMITCENKENDVCVYENGHDIASANDISQKSIWYAYQTKEAVIYIPSKIKTLLNRGYLGINSDLFILCIPIVCHEICVGVLYLQNKEKAFDDELIQHLQNFSHVLASKTSVVRGLNIKNMLDAKNKEKILTKKEVEVLNLVSSGLSNAKIAEQLNIATGTVKRHMSNIYNTLKVENRTQAVAKAKELNII